MAANAEESPRYADTGAWLDNWTNEDKPLTPDEMGPELPEIEVDTPAEVPAEEQPAKRPPAKHVRRSQSQEPGRRYPRGL